MTPRALLIRAAILAGVVATGCADEKPPPRPRAAPAVAPAPAPVAAPTPEAPPQDLAYSAVGKRDPFRSFLVDAAETTGQSAFTRCSTPLGRFDMDQLRLVAVITGLADPVAMVEAPNGRGYALRRGSCIGRNGGVVSTVRTGELVVAEWIVRADGKRERALTLLRLPKEPALNIEE